jgi:hypothetical protein
LNTRDDFGDIARRRLGNFSRTLATPEPIKDWSPTSLKEKPIKIGAVGCWYRVCEVNGNPLQVRLASVIMLFYRLQIAAFRG